MPREAIGPGYGRQPGSSPVDLQGRGQMMNPQQKQFLEMMAKAIAGPSYSVPRAAGAAPEMLSRNIMGLAGGSQMRGGEAHQRDIQNLLMNMRGMAPDQRQMPQTGMTSQEQQYFGDAMIDVGGEMIPLGMLIGAFGDVFGRYWHKLPSGAHAVSKAPVDPERISATPFSKQAIVPGEAGYTATGDLPDPLSKSMNPPWERGGEWTMPGGRVEQPPVAGVSPSPQDYAQFSKEREAAGWGGWDKSPGKYRDQAFPDPEQAYVSGLLESPTGARVSDVADWAWEAKAHPMFTRGTPPDPAALQEMLRTLMEMPGLVQVPEHLDLFESMYRNMGNLDDYDIVRQGIYNFLDAAAQRGASGRSRATPRIPTGFNQ